MAPEQRIYEPGSEIEQTKPDSFPQAVWDAVKEVGGTLNACLAPKIRQDSPQEFDCALSEHSARWLTKYLIILSETSDSARHFNASDWVISENNKLVGWHYVENPPGALGKECGKIFCVAKQRNVGLPVSERQKIARGKGDNQNKLYLLPQAT
jgi:hypothetical protein